MYACMQLLPSATKLWQGNVFTPVCHSLHRGISASVHAEIHTPWADTPLSRHPPGRHLPPPAITAADGKHPTGMHSCFHLCSTVQLPYTNVTLQFFILAFAEFSGINISCNSFRIIQTCNLLY